MRTLICLRRTLFSLGSGVLAASVLTSCAEVDSITHLSGGDAGPAVVCLNTGGIFGESAPCPTVASVGSDSPPTFDGGPLLAAIPNPDGSYVGTTNLIDVSAYADFALLPSITDGALTVSFTPRMMKLSPSVWGNWSSPPFAETSTPHVLFSDFLNVAVLDLSEPVSIFGFEIAPNEFSTHTFTVDFIDSSGPTIVETIVQDAQGMQGSRLVASILAAPVDRVRISGTTASGFAIAQIRYGFGTVSALPVVEIEVPATINQRNRGMIPVTVLGSADFDVTEIDVATLAFGPSGASPAHNLANPGTLVDHLDDVNGDGFIDLALHFRQVEVGLTTDHTEACLAGTTEGGYAIDACAAVKVINPGRP